MPPVFAGAEPFQHDGGSTGVLLCHGFGGDPRTLRPWAEYLAAAGLTVRLPRLPGHGTSWTDLAGTSWPDWYGEADRALAGLRERCGQVFAMGLSMGGTLCLRLAELHADALRGLVLVNPGLTETKISLVPALRPVMKSLKSGPPDIKRELAPHPTYDRTPVRALAELRRGLAATRRDLAKVRQPVLAYRSSTDHVLGPASVRLLQRTLPASQLTVRELADSYHVATLDNDAGAIFAGSLDFVRQHRTRE